MSGVRQYLEVAIDLIDPDPEQPRRDMNPESLQELAHSIGAMGIEQPINIRKHPLKPDRYMIISGERRWRAALLAGQAAVPVILRGEMEIADLRRRQLAENYHRENFNPVEEAEFLQKWVDTLHRQGIENPHTVVATELGISLPTLSKKLQVLRFDAEIRALVRDGIIRDNAALRSLSHLGKTDRELVIEKAKTGDFNFKAFRNDQRKVLRELRAARKPTKAQPAISPQATSAAKYLRWHLTRETLLKLMTNTDFRHHLGDVDMANMSDEVLSGLFEQFKVWLDSH